jgi:glycosyltransferase 2 family protein
VNRTLRTLRRVSPLLGLLLLLLLLPHLDFREAWERTQAIPLQTAIAAVAAYMVNVLLKALRWHRMLRRQGIPIPWNVSCAAFLNGAFYGMLTIGRIGELMRSEALLKYSQSKAEAFANSLADRVLDAAFLLLVAALCSVSMARGWGYTYACAAGSVVLTGLAIAVYRSWRQPVLDRKPTATGRFLGTVTRVLLGPGAAESIAWTVLSWSAYCAAVCLLAAGLGLNAPPAAIVRATAIGAAASALPISFQGLGTREAVFAATLAPYGVLTSQALTLSLVTLVLFYVVVLPLGGLGVFARHRQLFGARARASVSSQAA